MDLTKPLNFLSHLKENNNRTWFNANKNRYEEARSEFEVLINHLIPIVKEIDGNVDGASAKEYMFRIYRDVRFPKDKSPYKTNFGAFISQGGRKSPYAGYYVHMEPGASFIGGGVYMPESRFLRAIRTAIHDHTDDFKEILSSAEFKRYFNELYGEKLKSAPRGFPKEFADIELLKYKHYSVVHNVVDSFWESESVVEDVAKVFQALLPLNQFLNRVIEKAINL